ncbi:hypothetical protein [Escherichia coli]|uniref:hypothetical protein n=1 Tax=Escherichia coli TaxID=562 RepID=UPI00031F937F|nr:hypothetical protein [Escherichia coli]
MTSNKTLLARTGEWQTLRTGKFQTTGFENVDNAFATLISNIFSDILLVAPRAGRKTLCVIPESSTSRACLYGPFRQCDRVS